MILYILIGLNLITMMLLGFEYYKQTRKNYYAIILNKKGETQLKKKINPSYNEFKYTYDDKDYSHIIPNDVSFIKFKRDKLILYEFNKTEPINPIKEVDTRIYADVFNELLLMNKIKALNEAKKGLFDNINKKWIFGGLVVIVLIIVLIRGGV